MLKKTQISNLIFLNFQVKFCNPVCIFSPNLKPSYFAINLPYFTIILPSFAIICHHFAIIFPSFCHHLPSFWNHLPSICNHSAIILPSFAIILRVPGRICVPTNASRDANASQQMRPGRICVPVRSHHIKKDMSHPKKHQKTTKIWLKQRRYPKNGIYRCGKRSIFYDKMSVATR